MQALRKMQSLFAYSNENIGDKMKTHILFDLDGTLVNNAEGIVKCVYYALDALGITEDEPERLLNFIGPPLEDSFRDYYDLHDTGVKKAVEKYRERYKKRGVHECEVYPGIKEVLCALKENGKTICLATSKPQVFAEKILKAHEIFDCFDILVGASLDGTLQKKADVIRKVIKLAGVPVQEMIMVGDRHHDIDGAKECEMQSVGVQYGFAEKMELEEAGADFIAENMQELQELLLNC
jgi:Predicted phosphatases